MQTYDSSKGIDCLGEGDNTTAMVLISPTIKESIICTEPTYQMDIYPTILHVIGCTDPAWRGVGLDLLGNEPRSLNSREAAELSDKLIRGKYFSK